MEDEKSRRKTIHEKLSEMAMKEEGRENEKSKKIRKETRDQLLEEAEVERQLGEDSGHLENDLQGEEED